MSKPVYGYYSAGSSTPFAWKALALSMQVPQCPHGLSPVSYTHLDVYKRQVLTIVGESGSGKTTLIRALMGLLPVGGEVTDGTMIFNGHNLRTLSKSEWRAIRGKDMAMIFQDSGSALDPIVRIGKQFKMCIRDRYMYSGL